MDTTTSGRRLRLVTAGAATVLTIALFGWSGGVSSGAPTVESHRQVAPPNDVRAADFDPRSFDRSTRITNKWFPLNPGTQLVFRGSTLEGKERIPHRLIFTVTDLTKTIAGVRNLVIWDRDYSAVELVEAEIAFFAQDNHGNVWQLGEYPEEYEDGKIVASPAWIHGMQHARAGLSMKGKPRLGTPSYSLGWGPAVGFNDRAIVSKVGQSTCVPLRCFTRVLVIDEFNPDEPGKHQLKYYAPGVGNVRVGWAGKNEESKETVVLVKINHLDPKAMSAARAAALDLEARAYTRRRAVYGRTPPAEPLRTSE